VVDSIGAGDAFMGSFLAWWHGRGLGRTDLTDTAGVAEGAAFACTAAAITCSRPGADPPRLRELDTSL
jgi:fructokinase